MRIIVSSAHVCSSELYDREVSARSVDGGAYGATSLPLHHSLRDQSPSPSLRDREDRQRPLATPKRTLRTILSASTLRSADLGNLPGPVAPHIARPDRKSTRLNPRH